VAQLFSESALLRAPRQKSGGGAAPQKEAEE